MSIAMTLARDLKHSATVAMTYTDDLMLSGIAQESTVFIVDDGAGGFAESARVLEHAGFAVRILTRPALVVEQSSTCRSACVLANLHARGFDALELPRSFARLGCTAPVVFLTDRTDVRGTVQAMKAGALDVLVEPIDSRELLGAIRAAMVQDSVARRARALHDERRQRVALLTPREHEVCGWVSAGLMNKQIAARLGIAEKTVKLHRGQAMRKLGVASVPELVRMVDALHPEHTGIRPSSSRRPESRRPVDPPAYPMAAARSKDVFVET